MTAQLPEDETLLRRPPPPAPFRATELVLSVAQGAVERAYALFAPYTRARLEACCFWFGTRDGAGNGIVRGVVIPSQQNTWGNYHVTAEAVEAMADAAAERGWVNLAQLHTHPGDMVEHSRYDDAMASSRRALSLVLPFYGARREAWPIGIGVHEFQSDYWHLLGAGEATRRVQVVAGVVMEVDLR